MKLSLLSINALAFGTQWGLTSATSFENTAPILVSSNIANNVESKYIDTIDNVNNLLEQISEGLCAKKQKQPLIYLRMHKFDEFQPSYFDFLNTDTTTLKTLTNLVVYPNKESAFNVKLGESCVNTVNVESVDENSLNWSNDIQVALIDIYNSADIKDTIEKITEKIDMESLIVQVVPAFELPSNSLLQQTSEKIKEFIYSNKKREEIDYDAVEQELKNSFDEINELLDDSPVSALSDKNSLKNGEASIVNPNGSLFDNYAFFSTGIWMTTIVFLFLAWLLNIALGWLGDLKISYRAFDKAIDFEKKLQ